MVNFYFKLAYTSNTRTYDINLSHTTAVLYDRLKTLVQNDFGLNSFDIVIAGQDQAERAQSIPKNTIIFRHILNNNINRAFYIRNGQTSDIQLPQSDSESIQIDQSENSECYECPVCTISSTETQLYTHYSCSHQICDNCYSNWRQTNYHNHNRCPICRSD